MRVGTFPAPWGVQTSTERSEVGANTPLLRSRRQTPLWRLSACTGEVYFLTGNSIANCASGTVPYQIYDLKNVGNLAGILKADGYQAFAVHPQYKGNWNRMRTYANFGFDDFLGIEDFEDPRYVRSFVSDQSSFDKVIELYEQDRGKQFIFNVTMQNLH